MVGLGYALPMRYEFKPVVRCNMCGSENFRMLGMRLSSSQGLDPRKAEGVAVPIKRCRDCGLIFSDPQPFPDNLSDHYGVPPDEYWNAEPRWAPDYFSRQIEVAKQLTGFVPGMRALDIGAGTGLAMKSLSAAGFDTWGIEPSGPFRQRAIETGTDPQRINLAGIEEAEFPAEDFDFITFGAVLEHLFNPRQALEKAIGWLKPGGVIQAEVPSSDWFIARLVNLFFRIRGTNYVTHLSPMHPPFHLYEFTVKSFRDFQIARHWYDVCHVTHIPSPLKPLFRWWMKQSGGGMQLTVYLRKPS